MFMIATGGDIMFWKKSIIALLLVLLFSGCGLTDIQDDPVHSTNTDDNIVKNSDNFGVATVTRVVDGDTIKIDLNGEKETVRLLLVDTPETKHPNLPEQPYGKEASAFAVEKLEGKEIEIEFDGPKRDQYDRLLAYIWIEGTNFNQLLLEEGLARFAYVYDPPYTHQDKMKQAEKRALQAGIGIWSEDNYVTDSGFDHENVNTENKTSGQANDNVYYRNCSEAREDGVTPLYEGDPGYGTHMDGDRDGIACE